MYINDFFFKNLLKKKKIFVYHSFSIKFFNFFIKTFINFFIKNGKKLKIENYVINNLYIFKKQFKNILFFKNNYIYFFFFIYLLFFNFFKFKKIRIGKKFINLPVIVSKKRSNFIIFFNLKKSINSFNNFQKGFIHEFQYLIDFVFSKKYIPNTIPTNSVSLQSLNNHYKESIQNKIYVFDYFYSKK